MHFQTQRPRFNPNTIEHPLPFDKNFFCSPVNYTTNVRAVARLMLYTSTNDSHFSLFSFTNNVFLRALNFVSSTMCFVNFYRVKDATNLCAINLKCSFN